MCVFTYRIWCICRYMRVSYLMYVYIMSDARIHRIVSHLVYDLYVTVACLYVSYLMKVHMYACMYVLHLMYACMHRICFTCNITCMCAAHLMYTWAHLMWIYVSHLCMYRVYRMYVCIISGVGGVIASGLSASLVLHAGIDKCQFPALSILSAHALCRPCVSCICFSRASLCLLVSTFYYIPLCMFAKLFRSGTQFTRCVSFAMFVCLVCARATLQVASHACYVSFE